jgi:hypothetical protein
MGVGVMRHHATGPWHHSGITPPGRSVLSAYWLSRTHDVALCIVGTMPHNKHIRIVMPHSGTLCGAVQALPLLHHTRPRARLIPTHDEYCS